MLDLKTKHWPCMFGPFSVTGGSYTQAGSGDPTPANVRAITAWKAANASTAVKRTGKNLFNIATAVVGTVDPATGLDQINVNFSRSPVILCLPSTAYVVSWTGNYTNNEPRAFFYTLGGVFISASTDPNYSSPFEFTTPATAYYVRFRVYGTFKADTQLEKAASATTYEPYIEKTCTLAAPAELYAGYLGDDWYWRRTALGLLLDGATETWDDTNFAASGYFETTLAKAAHATVSLACSRFTPATSAAADSNKIIVSGTSLKVYPADAVATDKAGWLAWLVSNNVTVAYNLATADVITPVFP